MATKKAASAAHAPGRYAHPFYSDTPPAQRLAVNGMTRMTDWSKLQLGPVPAPARNGMFSLADVIGASGAAEVAAAGEIRFHTLGDSGQGSAQDAENVSEEMAGDYKPSGGGVNPSFMLHLGDVLYGPDKEAHYSDRFFRPYIHYPGKIIAIPGNHDGEVRAAADSPSLSAFHTNFCPPTPGVPVAASGIGIYREMAAQPGVYWMLDTPFVRIIGLYSNLLENPGYLRGKTNGNEDTSQLTWLLKTLKTISTSPKKALVFATHHPPYSSAGHSGSTEMNQDITTACTQSNVFPDLFLSGHAHNYQRYTRNVGGKKIPYIVAGTGGMPPQPVPDASGQPFGAAQDVTYDAALKSLGYLYVTISASRLQTEFWPLGGSTTPYDPVTIQLV